MAQGCQRLLDVSEFTGRRAQAIAAAGVSPVGVPVIDAVDPAYVQVIPVNGATDPSNKRLMLCADNMTWKVSLLNN